MSLRRAGMFLGAGPLRDLHRAPVQGCEIAADTQPVGESAKGHLMFRKSPQMEEYTFTIGGCLAEVEPLQAEIQGILQASGFRLKQIHATVLALGEWLEYAIQNLPPEESSRRVGVRLSVGETEIRLRVQDDGPQLALPARETVPAVSHSSAGLNLHLMSSLVDELQLHRIGGSNVMEFVKQVVRPG